MKNMKDMKKTTRKFTPLSNAVIGCAIEVHRQLGPGLLESTYRQCLGHELSISGIAIRVEHALPVVYKGVQLDCGYRIDLFVEDEIIVELKSVDKLLPIHEAQLLTYLRLADVKQGFLINFNVTQLKEGLKSFVL
jgi:GxxExxY protein